MGAPVVVRRGVSMSNCRGDGPPGPPSEAPILGQLCASRSDHHRAPRSLRGVVSFLTQLHVALYCGRESGYNSSSGSLGELGHIGRRSGSSFPVLVTHEDLRLLSLVER